MHTFKKPLKTVFGLAFDVERATDTESGFRPAETDLGAKKHLFGDVRLLGFASLLRTGFADRLCIVGGKEGRFKGEDIARGWAIVQMLNKDHGIPGERLRFLVSDSNTLGNVQLICQHASKDERPCIVTNHYHLARASMDFFERGVGVRLVAAESFLLLEDPERKQWIIDRFGGGPYAERTAEEIQGMADKLRGSYASRTKN